MTVKPFALATQEDVLIAVDKTGYSIRRSDWKRIRKHIEQIELPDSVYQNAGWACLGVSGSALVAAISLAMTPGDIASNHPWVTPFCWILFGAALVVGLLCLKMTRGHREVVHRSRQMCVEEMDELERLYYPVEPERPTEVLTVRDLIAGKGILTYPTTAEVEAQDARDLFERSSSIETAASKKRARPKKRN